MQIELAYVSALQGEGEDRPEGNEGNADGDGHDTSPFRGLDGEIGMSRVMSPAAGAACRAHACRREPVSRRRGGGVPPEPAAQPGRHPAQPEHGRRGDEKPEEEQPAPGARQMVARHAETER
jgi:hypothetical protein